MLDCVCVSASSSLNHEQGSEELGASNKTVSVQINGCKPAMDLPIDKVGVKVLRIGLDAEKAARDVIYEVCFRRGSKVLVFRSAVMLYNYTSLAMEVLVRKGEKGNDNVTYILTPHTPTHTHTHTLDTQTRSKVLVFFSRL